jgi:hypothetical protein
MKNANSFTAPAYRVETTTFRLIGTFEDRQDAIDCAARGRTPRLVYRHNRPAGGTEGNYTLLQYGAGDFIALADDYQSGYDDGKLGNASARPGNMNYARGFGVGTARLMRQVELDTPFESMTPGGTNDAHADS